VVTGSSFIEGTTISDSQLMTTVLARSQMEVVANLGHNAYGPQQQLIVLKRYGLPLQPRTVIWMFTDLTDLRQATVYYHYQKDVPTGFWQAFFARSFSRQAFRMVRPVVEYAVRTVVGLFTMGRSPEGAGLAGFVKDSKGRRHNMYFQLAARPLNGEDLFALELTRNALEEAYRICTRRGIRMLVVFIPEKFRVYRDIAQFPADSVTRKWILNDMPKRLENTVASISPEIGYLDLTPALVEAATRGVFSYYTDDNHWSPEGEQIAAQAISRYLSETGSHR